MAKRPASEAKTDGGYWSSYSNLQHIKHELLRKYLGGWFPILSRWNGRVIYLDTHAGRGRHRHGQRGSPIVALETLLNHSARDQILKRCEIQFFFLEKYKDSADQLRAEVNRLGSLPKGVKVHVEEADYSEVLADICAMLDNGELPRLAPMFMFLDPYSFLLPSEQLRQIMAQPRCEMFINFMWRYMNMAISNESQAPNMDAMFGADNWQCLCNIADNDSRCERAVQIFRDRVGAGHPWVVKMHDNRNVLKYAMLYLTNHTKGLSLMKDAAWSLDGAGNFRFSQLDDPSQDSLLVPEPDLRPLLAMLKGLFADSHFSVEAAMLVVETSIWKPTHLRKALLQAIQDGEVELPNGEAKLVMKHNPQLRFRA